MERANGKEMIRKRSRISDIRPWRINRPRSPSSTMVSNGSSEGPTGGFYGDSEATGRRRNNGRSKTAFSYRTGVRGPLLAVRKETRSKVDCAGVNIAKNYPTRLVFLLVLPFRSIPIDIHILYVHLRNAMRLYLASVSPPFGFY